VGQVRWRRHHLSTSLEATPGTALDYEFLRNKVFNANEFFNKKQNFRPENQTTPFPSHRTNSAPRLVGRSEGQTFIFGSYEGYRLRSEPYSPTNVPTQPSEAVISPPLA